MAMQRQEDHAIETHEQFLQRASEVFPVDSSLDWSPFERAIFNSLMAKLIFNYGYDSISDAMLRAAYREMQGIVSRCADSEALPLPGHLAGTGRGRHSLSTASHHP